MAIKLKVDLHTHTAEDVSEIIGGRTNLIPAKDFIDLAVQHQFDALSFTHHAVMFNNPDVHQYARSKGLLLIPGVETFIRRKHVLLINFTEKKHILTYEDLKKYKKDSVLVIAPHPYYVAGMCLGNDLEKYIDYFDAIEYCHFYYKFFNLNRKAVRIARKYNLPLVGNSDTHHPRQFGTTYSYVYAAEKSIPAIISAIKQGQVEYVSHPLSFNDFLFEIKWLIEKIPYEIQMKFRHHLNNSSAKFIRKIVNLLKQNG